MTGFEIARLAIDALALTGGLGAFLYARAVRRDSANRNEIDDIRDASAGLDRRMTRVESRLDDAPTATALHEVALSLEHLSGELKVNNARLEGLEKIVTRLESITDRQEQHLLQGAGR